jgi:hypothetical protein
MKLLYSFHQLQIQMILGSSVVKMLMVAQLVDTYPV